MEKSTFTQGASMDRMAQVNYKTLSKLSNRYRQNSCMKKDMNALQTSGCDIIYNF